MKSSSKPTSPPQVPAPPAQSAPQPPPNLLGAIRQLVGGQALDNLVGRFVLNAKNVAHTRGLSTTWDGASRVAEVMAKHGCDIVLKVSAGKCFCRVTRDGTAKGAVRELGTAEALNLPEAVAKAALLACLELKPQSV